MHHVVILNPSAGKGSAAKQEPLMRRMLDERHIAYELVRTEGPMHAAQLAREAAARGAGVVVAAGGDGTCNEVINGLMELKEPQKRPAIGVLCAGRGNDFAFAAGIPQDMGEGVRVLAAGRRRTMDIGRLTRDGEPDGRYFGNGIGIGFDTIVGLEAAKMKRMGGFAGYMAGALKTILLFPDAPTIRLRYGEVELLQQAVQISLMNGRRMGGAFFMCPDSISDDGEIDLCVAGSVGRGQMIRLVFKFLKGNQESSSAVKTGRSTRFEITAEEGYLVVHADGETICTEGTHLVAESVPGAIEVVSGASEP